MDLNGLQYNPGAGLINGIAGGFKSAFEAYQDAADRKDKRRILAEHQKNQREMQQAGLILKGLIPRGTDYQAGQGEQIIPVGGQNYSYNPEMTPEAQRQNKLFQQQKALLAMKLGAQKQEKPSIAENAVDKAFAKEYTDFVPGGGYANAQRNLGEVNKALEELQSGKAKTGGLLSSLPETARDYVDRAAKANQDKIRQAVMSTLKQTLGAQFTEREGQKIFDLAYNPRQSSQENVRRVSNLANQLSAAIEAKKKAAKYYEEKGTLKGYKGSTSISPDSLLSQEESPKGLLPEAHAESGPKAGDIVDGYRFKGGNPADKSNWVKER